MAEQVRVPDTSSGDRISTVSAWSHLPVASHHVPDRVYRSQPKTQERRKKPTFSALPCRDQPRPAFDLQQSGPCPVSSFGVNIALQIPCGHWQSTGAPEVHLTPALVHGASSRGVVVGRTYHELLMLRLLRECLRAEFTPATFDTSLALVPPGSETRASPMHIWLLSSPVAVIVSSPFSDVSVDHLSWRLMLCDRGSLLSCGCNLLNCVQDHR